MKIKTLLMIVLLVLPISQSFAVAFAEPEASTFSKVVYDDWQHPSVPLPKGWLYLFPLPANLQTMGYYAEAFISCDLEGGGCDVVISHRGTSDVWDAYEDFEAMVGQEPYQYYTDALAYTGMVKKYVETHYSNYRIEYHQVGHSLGAILAELVVGSGIIEQSISQYENIVFESPGAKTIITNMIQQQQLPTDALDIVQNSTEHIFAKPDAINTWNEQTFSGYEFASVEDIMEDFSHAPLSTIGSPGVIYYFFSYSLNQHKIDNFYKYFHESSDNNIISAANDWPVGFNAGYKRYVTYGYGEYYWSSYMKYMWEHNQELHNKYKDDYYDFQDDFIAHLKNAQAHGNNHKELPIITRKLTDLDNKILAHESPITPITAHKRPTLYDVINNDYDGKAQIRRRIYAKASNQKKLYWAVMCGDTKFAQELLQQTSLSVNSQHGDKHFSLLQIAVKFGYLDIVKFLLKHHANPNLANSNGDTALHTVAKNRYSDASIYVSTLIANGANPSIKNKLGQTPLILMQHHSLKNAKAFSEAIQKGNYL